MEIERSVLFKIIPTPIELANVFCDFDADQQAEFFNTISQLTSEWRKGSPGTNCLDYPQEDWREEVHSGNTVLGYREWVEHKLEEDADER